MSRIPISISCAIGKKYGRLTVIADPVIRGPRREKHIPCICDCGSELTVYCQSLITGNTKSCGCLQGESRHLKSKSREYYSWKGMIQRCLNESHTYYPIYGGRGIRVCERWMDFRNFYSDMGDRPSGFTLDRIDNFGDYEPQNCRWASQKTQLRNMRANRLIYHNGEWKSAVEWSELSPVDYMTFLWRHKRGWPMDKIMSTPSKMTKNKGRKRVGNG